MRLTPMDIHHKEFRHAVRGYSEEEVDAFLDEVVVEFEQLYKDNMDLKEEINRLKDKMTQYESLEGTLRNTLVMAQKSAEDVKREAQKEAELIVQDSELKAKEIIRDTFEEKQELELQVQNLTKAEKEFRAKIREIMTSYMEMIEEAEAKADDIASRVAKRADETVEDLALDTTHFDMPASRESNRVQDSAPEAVIPPVVTGESKTEDSLGDSDFLFSAPVKTSTIGDEMPARVPGFGLEDLLDDEEDLIYRID